MAFSEYPKIVQIGQYSAELDAEAAIPSFLFASVFDNFNTLCEEYESTAADDAPVLLVCSFCSLSPHKSAECLGKAGDEVVVAHFVENEASECACPRCRKDALSKTHHAVEKPPAAFGENPDADAAPTPKKTTRRWLAGDNPASFQPIPTGRRPALFCNAQR